jgi:structural maintenance of chromosome 3 (chondroitin sulfate proteoglycan 6)
MISNLRYDPRFEKAMLQVFGKTLIARDLTVAAHMAQMHDLNTITLAGDRVDKKGALTGGFSDLTERGKSRLGAQAEIRRHQERFAEVKQELERVREDLGKFDTELAKILADISKQQEQKAALRSQNTQLAQEIKQAKIEHKSLIDTAARNEKLLPPLRASLASVETQIESLESESRSEFRSGLTAEEEAELKRLTAELAQARQELLKIRAKKADVEASKVALESLLNANLNRREEELHARLNTATQEEDTDVLQRDEQELAQLIQQIKELEAEIKANEKEMDHATTRVRTLQNELEKLRVSCTDIAAWPLDSRHVSLNLTRACCLSSLSCVDCRE